MSEGPRPLTLFDDAGRAHSEDPWTSRQAAASVRRGTQRWRVLEELGRAEEEGRTDSELGQELGIRETSAGTRRKELEELGLCERTAMTRRTLYGNPAQVHVISAAGLAELAAASQLRHPSVRP